MVNNDPIIWTMLNAIKEQQHEIEELKREIRHLRANTTRAGDDDNSITEICRVAHGLQDLGHPF